MPNGKDLHLPIEQVRRQVDQIMDRWRCFPSFAALLDALMDTNGLGNLELAQQLTHRTGRALSKSSIRQFRLGEREPSYVFIEDLLSTNALHFDPQRIQPTNGERPAGDQRLALFTVAGLIEVTPASIRQWNQEVLARHRCLLENVTARPRPRWGDLMTKLLSFHMQGGRQTYENLTTRCNAHGAPVFLNFDSYRINQLFRNARTPTERERHVLYHNAGLEEDQIAAIEDGIASGAIPLGFGRRRTVFAAALTSLLDKLAAQNVPLMELARRSASQHISIAAVSQTSLSAWRHGREQPTLAKLRALINALQQFGPGRLRDPVTPVEIDHLIAASGFHARDLTDTTHQIIARIDGQTRLKPLLRALQSAVDTCHPPEEIHRHGVELGYATSSIDMLRKWEEPGQTYPTSEQVSNLLRIHNHLIRQNGFQPLSEEEMAKAVAVVKRDHASWQALSHTEKLAEQHPFRPRRQPPSPYFDGSERGMCAASSESSPPAHP